MNQPFKYNKQPFSLNDFKDWLSENTNSSSFFDLSSRVDKGDQKAGKEAHARVSVKKLTEKIEVKEGEAEDLINEFIENGGMNLTTKNKYYLVEVESGSFYIPKFCVDVIQD